LKRILPITSLAICLLLPFTIQAASPNPVQELYQKRWTDIKTLDDGTTISEMKLPNLDVKAIKVTQTLDLDAELLAQVIEDIPNYVRIFSSAAGVESRLLHQTQDHLIAYQVVDAPLISDRIYGFRMFRPEGPTLRVDWQLIPAQELVNWDIDLRAGVYLESGMGSWEMENLENGKIRVSYRLIMDPGGWIPGALSDTFTEVSILGIFRDAIRETERRSTEMRG